MTRHGEGLVPFWLEPGDFWDRLTILELRVANATSNDSRRVAADELARARNAWAASTLTTDGLEEAVQELREINGRLWAAEDEIRRNHRRDDFGEGFVSAARTIVELNDRRADVRRAINAHCGRGVTADRKIYAD